MNEEMEKWSMQNGQMDYGQTFDHDWKKIHDAKKFVFKYPKQHSGKRGYGQIICYPEELFSNDGWCMVQNHKSEYDWGFCDTSCNLVKVCNASNVI